MLHTKLIVLGVIVLTFVGVFHIERPSIAEANIELTTYKTIRFNNENWHTLPHPKVASFEVRVDGSASGMTEDGRTFMQYTVPNPYGVRVQRFEIEDHHHYIVDGEIADSFQEFSALLAQAYARSITG